MPPKTPKPRRYEVEELLALAESPLVEKPAGLPPIEEWMGPPPSTTRPAAARARTEGDIANNAHEEGGPKSMASNRRPSLFDSRGLTSSRVHEDIVLGPPKLSFASASSSKKLAFDFDTSHSASLNSPAAGDEDSSPRFDRFRMQVRDTDKDRDGPSGRSVRGANKRGGLREEPEFTGASGSGAGITGTNRMGFGSRQPRKSFGAEDGDRFRRTTTDTSKDRPQRYENFGRDRDRRPGGKRDESSWILDEPRDRDNRDRDNRVDRDNRDRNERDNRDNRDGRGEFRNFSRDNRDNNNNNRYNKVEKDPEWMDAMPNEDGGGGESKGGHSMEEFQRWKARMKAANAPEEKKSRANEVSTPSPIDDKSGPVTPVEEKKPATKAEVTEAPPAASAPAVVENGVDRYFNFWNTPNPVSSPEQKAPLEQKPAMGRSSRFTSFFGPQEASAVPPPPQMPPARQPERMSPMPPQENSSNEDKEGFQRILKMLGSGGAGNGLSLGPSNTSPPQHNSPLLLQLQAASKPSHSPSNLHPSHPPPQQHHQQPQHHQPQPQQHQPHHHLQQQIPLPQPSSNLGNGPLESRDANANFLLQLMQRSSHHPSQQQGPPPLPSLNNHSYSGPSQMPPPPPISASPPAFQRPVKNIPVSPMFDDPAITGFRQRPNHEQNPMLQRGPPPMDRPPMEQHIPNWPPQQGPPQPGNQGPQQHRPIAPPPGFARPGPQHGPPPQVSHGLPPQFLGPPPGTNLAQLPPQFQMNNLPPPNFVPGPPPPPPFFGMGAPPNNYPMPPFHHEPMMALGGPHFPFSHELKSPPHGPGKPGQGF